MLKFEVFGCLPTSLIALFLDFPGDVWFTVGIKSVFSHLSQVLMLLSFVVF